MTTIQLTESQVAHLKRLLEEDKFYGDEITDSGFEVSHNVDCDLLLSKLEA